MKNQNDILPVIEVNPALDRNDLFPVFLKLSQLKLLIVGGGNVALEKLTAVLNNSPEANIRLVSVTISTQIKELVKDYPAVHLVEKEYEANDINGADLIITAVNDQKVSEQVRADAKQKNKLVNAADKPGLCDFYLSSVVQKGNLKIAISTNGKSPTIAKRVKEMLNDAIPEEINSLLYNMQSIRDKMSGDFAGKVRQLNELTKILSEKNDTL